MYECNSNIGCLAGSVSRVGKGLTGQVNRFGPELSGSCIRIGKGLSGQVSLVCSLNRNAYLCVNPDVVWLTFGMLPSAEFDIYSNVVWGID